VAGRRGVMNFNNSSSNNYTQQQRATRSNNIICQVALLACLDRCCSSVHQISNAIACYNIAISLAAIITSKFLKIQPPLHP
jgi:hypothetical protein